jgi:hypothetical protein
VSPAERLAIRCAIFGVIWVGLADGKLAAVGGRPGFDRQDALDPRRTAIGATLSPERVLAKDRNPPKLAIRH